MKDFALSNDAGESSGRQQQLREALGRHQQLGEAAAAQGGDGIGGGAECWEAESAQWKLGVAAPPRWKLWATLGGWHQHWQMTWSRQQPERTEPSA
jgi:hypothetical protein